MKIEVATRAEVPQLVELHQLCLPASILSALGDDAISRYYEYVVASTREYVFIALDAEDAVVAGCVLSFSPGSLLRRFAVEHPVSAVRDLAKGAVLTAELRHRVRERAREAVAGLLRRRRATTDRDEPDSQGSLPEVTQMFTEPALRGQGYGKALLARCEDTLRARRHKAYCIHTLRDDNADGIRFYEREGFVLTGSTSSFGDAFLVMTKELS